MRPVLAEGMKASVTSTNASEIGQDLSLPTLTASGRWTMRSWRRGLKKKAQVVRLLKIAVAQALTRQKQNALNAGSTG